MMLLVSTVLWSLFFLSAAKTLRDERKILSDILDGYEAHIRPAGENGTGPVQIEVNTYIRALNNVDDEKMIFDVQLTFRQAWIDDRLRYTNKDFEYISLTSPALIWTPDLFFGNEDSGKFHNILKPNVLVRIFPNGKVLYSIRVSLKLFCDMDFSKYPLDSQHCNIIAASYGFTTQDISFAWQKNNPVQVRKSLLENNTPRFKLASIHTNNCNSKTSTGEYSCLKIELHLSRHFFYYLVNIYMPTSAMVLLSWLVFWLHPKHSALRFGISITSLVCSVLITSPISNRSPQLSYATAMDVWIGVCFCFLFGSIFESFLVVNMFCDSEKKVSNEITEKTSKPLKFTSNPLTWLSAINTPRIDLFSRFIFPVAFESFVLIYWLKYKEA